MFLMRKKKDQIKIIAEFSASKIAPRMLCNYLAYLAMHENVRFIGYRYIEKRNEKRIILLAQTFNRYAIQYFADRCPAMIEKEAMEHATYTDVEWYLMPAGGGFTYVNPKVTVASMVMNSLDHT